MALMTKTLDRIQTLVAHNEVRVSLHGSEELAADDVQVRDVGVATTPTASRVAIARISGAWTVTTTAGPANGKGAPR